MTRRTERWIVAGWMIVMLAVVPARAATADESLVDAARIGDVAKVQSLLRQHVDVNSRGLDGSTALHWAANREDVTMVAALIRAGADVKATNRHGVTPLSLACLKGNAAVIEMLLKAGADPNTSLPEGETALMTAARTGKVDAVRVLIDHGANVQAKERVRNQTALMWAAAEGHTDTVRLLVRAGADIHALSTPAPPATGRLGGAPPKAPPSAAGTGEQSAVAASKAAKSVVNDSTIPQGALPDTSEELEHQPAAEAPKGKGGATKGDEPKGEGYPAPPPASGMTPFMFAVRAGQIGAVKALLEAGVNVNETLADGTSALNVAIINGHYDLAKLLLDEGADPNAAKQGWAPLHQVLLTRRPSLFRPYPFPVPHGETTDFALMSALIDHGAEVNTLTTKAPRDGIRSVGRKIGATPFFLAAKGADVEAMKFLVSKGADIFEPNDEGTTPLMVAAGVGIWRIGESPGTNEEALEAVKYIVSLGGDVRTIDKNGETAVHGAAHRGSPELIGFLASKGANLDVQNKMGWTPLTIAGGIYYPNLYEHYPEAQAMLEKLGAKALGTRRAIDAQPQQEGALPVKPQPE
jgi:ankyrin repeat protein